MNGEFIFKGRIGSKDPKYGFTLIELMVVIGIVAILGAMLLPALAKAKQRAQGNQCVSNIKSLYAGWQMYSADNQGNLVPNGDEADQPANLTDTANPQWCPGRQDDTTGKWLSTDRLIQFDSSPAHNVGYEWIAKGLIFPYVKDYKMYKCPADNFSKTLNFGPHLTYTHVRSMSMNEYLSPVKKWTGVSETASAVVYYKESSIVHPSDMYVFLDENPYSINDGCFVCVPAHPLWIKIPASYHNGGSAMVFVDGHSETHQWHDPTVLTFNSEPQYGSVPNIISPPQQPKPYEDLTWLETKSTQTSIPAPWFP